MSHRNTVSAYCEKLRSASSRKIFTLSATRCAHSRDIAERMVSALNDAPSVERFAFQRRWLTDDALEVYAAMLSKRQSVESLQIDTSLPRVAGYRFMAAEAIVDALLLAVSARSNLQQLRLLGSVGSPGSLGSLLRRLSQSLTYLHIHDAILPVDDLVQSLADCQSLTNVKITGTSTNLAWFLEGLYQHPSLKVLTLTVSDQTGLPGYWDSARTLVARNRAIQKLTLDWKRTSQLLRPVMSVSYLLEHSHESVIEELTLRSWQIQDDARIVLTTPVNSSVKVLAIPMCALWHPASIRFELFSGLERVLFSITDLSGMTDGPNWRMLLRQNAQLRLVQLFSSPLSNGVILALSAATCTPHPSLGSLEIEVDDRNVPCVALEGFVADYALSSLSIESQRALHRSLGTESTEAIARGLMRNVFLQSLALSSGKFVGCIGALRHHPTLNRLQIEDTVFMSGTDLGSLLHHNPTIAQLVLSNCEFQLASFRELCQHPWPRLEKLWIMQSAGVDLLALGGSIEEAGVLEEVLLRKLSNVVEQTEASQLFDGIGQAKNLRRVHYEYQIKDEPTAEAVLNAVENNDLLVEFGGLSFLPTIGEYGIKFSYFLNLNRAGRALLHCKNLPAALWPRILGRIILKGDTDVLSFFVRKKVPELMH